MKITISYHTYIFPHETYYLTVEENRGYVSYLYSSHYVREYRTKENGLRETIYL